VLSYKFYVGRSVVWTCELRWRARVWKRFAYMVVLKVINQGKVLE